MLQRHRRQVVARPGRVDQVACDHRVDRQPAQLHAVRAELQRRGLEVVADLRDAGILENLLQPRNHLVKRQAALGVEQRRSLL